MKKDREIIDLTPRAEDKVVEEIKQLRGAIEDLTAIVMGLISKDPVNKV